jgi:hypothetical protein
MATTANPIITMVVGTASGAGDLLPQLAAHYGATRTHGSWPGVDQLELGDLFLVDEVAEEISSRLIAVNVILLPDNQGVLFQEIPLAEALAELALPNKEPSP